MEKQKYYAAIDLKSFYASVECIYRELDPLTTNLVVADLSRTEKTICLAVSPSLKAMGIPGRPRLFEVVQKVREINALRQARIGRHAFLRGSYDAMELEGNPYYSVDYIVAPPRMAHYMRHSAKVYETYLKYVAPEDIHVYSIDEVFIDITPYLHCSGLTPREFVRQMVLDVLESTGVTATAGIGTNLYLCKVAMDIVAKHTEPDEFGARIAQLDEISYRESLWTHRPLTDFWRIGPGYTKKLEQAGLYTMGDVARCSLGGPGDFYNEDLLYKLFGVNAELLIDHAWGWEPCTLAHIKADKPTTNSLSSGQVLHQPYPWDKARLIVREMTDLLVLDLVEKGLVTDQLVLTVGYDMENITHGSYRGEAVTDHYGRKIPKHAHGTVNLPFACSSTSRIMEAVVGLFDRIADPALLVRRITIGANHVVEERSLPREPEWQQLDLLADPEEERRKAEEKAALERERRRQKVVLHIRHKYGKNAILRGMNLEEGATAVERNSQIGGHKA